jgi:hypothetical protein
MKAVLGKEYGMTIDNYYSLPQLKDTLTENKTDTYGMVQMNRKEVPNDL